MTQRSEAGSSSALCNADSVRYRRRQILVGVGVLVFLVSAVLLLPHQGRLLRTRATAARQVDTVGGVPRLGGLASSTPEFLADVRAHVPPRARIRMLVGPGTPSAPACDPAPGQFFFLAYQVLPRAVVCDASPRWWVLYRTPGVELPPGSVVAVDLAPGLRLVDTRPGDSS
jgi:hypothetical protein